MMRHVIRHVMDEPIVTSQVHFLERVTMFVQLPGLFHHGILCMLAQIGRAHV